MKLSLPPAQRRTRGDFLAAGAIALATAVLIGGAYVSSDARHSELMTAASPIDAASVGDSATSPVPDELRPAWTAPTVGTKLAVDDGAVLVQTSPHTIAVKDVATGQDAWTYRTANPICGTAMNWDNTLVITRSPKGCGEVTSLVTSTGQYHNTRSALASDDVAVQQSNDNVGTVSHERVELWRNDLVRTVEVGAVEAPAQPGKQANPECRIASSLWRTELLAVVQACANKSIIRLTDAVPDESSEPQDFGGWNITSGSQLVAIGQDRAAVYSDGVLQVFHKDGTTVDSFPMSATLPHEDGAFSPATADLPHNMTWWDGSTLHAFDPATLRPTWKVESALGTGASMGGRALIPVAEGLAVVNWDTGRVERTIPVDRGGYNGPVTVKVAGRYVVEQRGETIVALS